MLENRFPSDLPVTGAWQVGDIAGDRQFVVVAERDHPFALEGGGELNEIRVAYETWGKLDDTSSNAVLICHALTGDSHAAGASTHIYPAGGWWNDMVGPGKAICTDKYFVVCSNVLGGCQGTTGPVDIMQRPSETVVAGSKAQRYGSSFPVVTIRDMVRVQALLSDHLGIRTWKSVVGGSMGGMQVLEWSIMYPHRVRSTVLLATCAYASPMQIAWSALGRLAVANDPHWYGGDYYEKASGPWRGLALARELAQVTYRSSAMFNKQFGRDLFDITNMYNLWGRFQIESYLDHHGQKLVRRFDANSYLMLNKAMDLHDIGRGRGGVSEALGRIVAPTFVVAISSDMLYPPFQQLEIYEGIISKGGHSRHMMVESDKGHDGFLLASDVLFEPVGAFLDAVK